MRKSLLALCGGVTLLAGLVTVPASAGTAAAEPFEPQPGEYKIIQGYTKDPRYVGKPGAVVDALSRGVPVEQLGGGKQYNKHHRLPHTEAEAKRMREQSGQSYTVDAEGRRQGARAADPHNFETCKKNYLKAGEPGGWVRDHFSWCEAGTAWATVFPPGGGQEQVETTVYLVGFGKKGARPGTTTDRYMEFQIRADEWRFKGDGPGPHLWERAKEEATFEAKMICTPNPDAAACESGDRNGRKDTIAGWLKSGWAESQLKSAGKPAQKVNGDQVQRATVFGWYQFTFPTLTTNPDHSTSDGTGVRFDTAYYMYKVAKRASIFDRVDPFLAFSDQANSPMPFR